MNNTISGAPQIGNRPLEAGDPPAAKKTKGNRLVRKIKSQPRLAAAFEKRFGALKRNSGGDKNILKKLFKFRNEQADPPTSTATGNSDRIAGLKRDIESCNTQQKFKYYFSELISMFPGDENLSKIENEFLQRRTPNDNLSHSMNENQI